MQKEIIISAIVYILVSLTSRLGNISAEYIQEVRIGGRTVPIHYEAPEPLLHPAANNDAEDIPVDDFPPDVPQSHSNNHTMNSTLGKDTTNNETYSEEDIQLRSAQQTNSEGEYYPEPEDTGAQYGDPCNPSSALTWDYCEKAQYPHKGRMICATDDMDKNRAGTCVCKYGRNMRDKTKWRQLRYDQEKKLCLSPEGGLCFVKFPVIKSVQNHTKESGEVYQIVTYVTNNVGNPIYQKNVTMAHEQCDNKGRHGDELLECSQAHPRRFLSFNAYNYYCLSKENRLETLLNETAN